jgi:hypothetical protein
MVISISTPAAAAGGDARDWPRGSAINKSFCFFFQKEVLSSVLF